MFNKIKQKEIIDFNKTFSLMLLARLTIIQSLELYHAQVKNEEFKRILKEILGQLKSGKSLSLSFSKYKEIFPDIYIANLKAGEETGQIAEVLTEYSTYQESIYTLKKKISQALRYPVLVIIVSLAVVIFMVFFLIPAFEGLFTTSSGNLPPLTETIINISYFIRDNFLFMMFIIVAAGSILFKTRKSRAIKDRIDYFLVRTPYISTLYKKNILARFAYSMAIMLKSRVTLVEALQISKNISNNSLFKNEIEKIVKKINKGEQLSVNVNKSYFFDITFSRLLSVGEESAGLDKVFSLISGYYSKEFDYHVDSLTSLIEPILILFIGLIVALILVAMYLPMFEIVNNFGM